MTWYINLDKHSVIMYIDIKLNRTGVKSVTTYINSNTVSAFFNSVLRLTLSG
jgi:hypothetical protein